MMEPITSVQFDLGAVTNLERLLLSQAVHEFGTRRDHGGADPWVAIAKVLANHPMLKTANSTTPFTPQVSIVSFATFHADVP